MSSLQIIILCAISAAMYGFVYTQDGEFVPEDASPPPTNATVPYSAAQNSTCDNIALLGFATSCVCPDYYTFNEQDLLSSKEFIKLIVNGSDNMCPNRIDDDPTVTLPPLTKYTIDLCIGILSQLWYGRGYCDTYWNFNVTNLRKYGNQTLNYGYSFRSSCQTAVGLFDPQNYGCPAGATCL